MDSGRVIANTCLIVLAPTTDYAPEELKKLDRFLDNEGMFGKTLIYVASHEQPALPGRISEEMQEKMRARMQRKAREKLTERIWPRRGLCWQAMRSTGRTGKR